MTIQAITTKFLGPTNVRGSRVKATAEAGSVTLNWDHRLNPATNHQAAAKALAEKMGWGGQWIEGGLPGGGSVFVWNYNSNMKADGFTVYENGPVEAA